MVRFIGRIIGNSIALYLAFLFVPGFIFSGTIQQYVLAGALLAVLNAIVKPIVKAISFPLIILTLGLFTLVINALMLWIVDYAFNFVTIQSITALVIATILISIVNLIVSGFSKLA